MVNYKALGLLTKQLHEQINSKKDGDSTVDSEIINTIEQLRRTAEPPALFIRKTRYRPIQNVIIIMAIEMGLVHGLAEASPDKVTAEQLALDVKYQEDVVVRVMRVMTSLGFCDETGHCEYKANDVTHELTEPTTLGSLVPSNDWMFRVGTRIREYIQKEKPLIEGKRRIAYDYAMGHSVWEGLKSNPAEKAAFDDAMAARAKMKPGPWHKKYDFASELAHKINLDEEVIVVDVGGNIGHDLRNLRRDFPHAKGRFILQDLPETIERLEKPLEHGIEAMKYDFFTPQIVKEANIYYFRSICHDWNDVACVKLLSNTAKAMAPHSRILIDEIVLLDRGENLVLATIDVQMMLLHDGKERSHSQWKALLQSVQPPLEIAKVWKLAGDEQDILEVKLKGSQDGC